MVAAGGDVQIKKSPTQSAPPNHSERLFCIVNVSSCPAHEQVPSARYASGTHVNPILHIADAQPLRSETNSFTLQVHVFMQSGFALGSSNLCTLPSTQSSYSLRVQVCTGRGRPIRFWCDCQTARRATLDGTTHLQVNKSQFEPTPTKRDIKMSTSRLLIPALLPTHSSVLHYHTHTYHSQLLL